MKPFFCSSLSFLLVWLSAFMLQSCVGSGREVTPTIADLQYKTENISPYVNFDVSHQQLIDSYRQLVLITPHGEQYGKEMQRLADLELEASMDNKLSDNEKTVNQGEQQILAAINRYEQYLKVYPERKDNDVILYQLSRAYAVESNPEKAQYYMERLVSGFPESAYIDEVQFRLGENYFVSGVYAKAEQAYGAVVRHFSDSIYYDKSLYKLGWSQFKQNKNEQAIHSFIRLLDLKQQQQMLDELSLSQTLGRSEQELIEDVMRVISLSFSYLDNKQAIAVYFKKNGSRPYEPLLYTELAKLYLSKERITDAADIYLLYGDNHSFSRFAPVFHGRAIAVYKKSAFSSLLLPEKKRFVEKYNVGTAFWAQQSLATKAELQPVLTAHMSDIAMHYHATARSSKKASDFKRTASWYQQYLDSFPRDDKAAEINFLLAESRFDAGQYASAIVEYEKTAYSYPRHKNSAEAAYAALIAYNKLYTGSSKKDKTKINDNLLQSSLKFSYFFPDDKRMPDVLLKTAEQFFDLKQYVQANTAVQRLLNNPQLDVKLKHRAWIVIAHSNFKLKNFSVAEDAYLQVLSGMSEKDRKRKNILEQLASSIYKQGELEREAGNHQLAAMHFLRVARAVPASSIRAIAEYDAATEYLALQQWPEVIKLLQDFRKRYPDQKKWQLGITQKLALAYNNSGDYANAADEMMKLISLSPKDQQQDLLWQSAVLYDKAGMQQQTIATYKSYIKKYPQPLVRTIELRHKIALHYLAAKDSKRYHYWLKEIIKADASGGSQRTDRTRYLAASANLELVKPIHEQYSQVKLTTPLKKSLKKKKRLMKQSIEAYTKAAKYQIEEVTTAATFNIAEIYRDFASALLASERPKKLTEEELEEYNYLLEDQAYPFEEKAIAIHEVNVARIPDGSFDDSIKNSLSVLGGMMPFRYAKSELTDNYVQ